MLGLLQNVAILGILGLGMAIVVIGRGIDISMVAVLAVPGGPGAADGAGRALAARRVRCRARAGAGVRPRQRLADRLRRGAVALHHARVGPLSRRARPGRAVSPRHRAVEPAARCVRLDRPRHAGRRADAGDHVRRGRAAGELLPAQDPARHLRLRDRRQPVRRAHHRNPDPPGDRAAVRARGADRHVRRPGDGGVGEQHADAHLQLDHDLRRDPRRRARRHRPVGRPRRRAATS